MKNTTQLLQDLSYLGANDRRIALFESAFPVPRGVSYNSYLLKDEKTVLFDTVDSAVAEQFFENLEGELDGRPLDFVVVHHMEPDHSATFKRLMERYPDTTVVTSEKALKMMGFYFGFEGKNVHIVKDGDTMSVGRHTICFVSAPMVHWPEVLMSYLPEEGVLFSADAFGTFGALDAVFADELNFERDYLDDARRYYFNIVGKYGQQVQAVLKKAANLKISMVCPLHGPVWRKNFGWYLEKYNTWSSYRPEERGVAVFYSSVYGHTQNAAELLSAELAKKGLPVRVYDVSVRDTSEMLSEAFRYSHLVFATTTYNNGIFVSMERLLADLRAHAMQGRKYSLIENGSWSPQAGKLMDAEIIGWKGMEKVGETVTVLSAVNETSRTAILRLAEAIFENFERTREV